MLIDARTRSLTERFYAWERRGRGHDLYEAPVELEPPFAWPDWHARPEARIDDTHRAHWLRRLLTGRLLPRQQDEPEGKTHEPLAHASRRAEPLRELALVLPPGEAVAPEHSAAWLASLATLTHPLAFELVAEQERGEGRVSLRFACARSDEALLRSSLLSVAPSLDLRTVPPLLEVWQGGSLAAGSSPSQTYFVEFGLGREFMLLLVGYSARGLDTLSPLVTGLASLARGLAVLQVLFVPTEAPWARATLEAVTTPGGQPFLADAPEITRGAAEKLATPLFAVVLRLAVKAESEQSAYGVVRSVAGGLARLGSPAGNELVPLASGDAETLEADLLRRTSHRTGMLLSSRELAALVRLPSTPATTALVCPATAGKAAPESTREPSAESVLLGENPVGGAFRPVYLREADRLRHTHVLGASGTGKSTLLVRLILQDIAAGRGVAVLDPHGDLVDEVLARMPEERVADTVLFDPSDPDAVVGWNILAAGSESERQLLASDLVAVFRRLATSWGDQMTAVLANAILAFLNAPGGGTLLDLRRFLVEKAFRERVVASLRDPHLVSFWRTEFPLLIGRRPQAPILTRLDTLLRHRLVRDVVSVRERALDFRAVVDERRVFLARLAQGAIGRENAALLGSLLAARFHHTALARQDTAVSARSAFFLYLDEFHELATPSMATLFSGIRKYGVGLTVAHQSLHQLRSSLPEVERAVLDNAHTRIAFRVGEEDARRLASGFAGFSPEALTSLPVGQAVARIGGSGGDFDLTTEPLPELDEAEAVERRERVRAASRKRWARPRPALPEVGTVPAAPAPAAPPPAPVKTAPLPPGEASQGPPQRSPAEGTPAEEEALSEHGVPSERRTAQDTRGTLAPKQVPVPERAAEGRGGPEHQYLQSLVREWAQARGFKADLEYELPAGGRIDLLLSRGDRRVAVEISVSTGTEHELGNVRKCLDAGFEHVFVVSLKRGFLKCMEELLVEYLDKKELLRVHPVTPEALLAWLADEPTSEATVAGYTVRTQHRSEGAPESEARRQRLVDVIGKSIRRIGKDDS